LEGFLQDIARVQEARYQTAKERRDRDWRREAERTDMPEQHKIIERVTVSGPRADHTAARERLRESGYELRRSGPYSDRDMHPRVDVERFLYIAERTLAEWEQPNHTSWELKRPAIADFDHFLALLIDHGWEYSVHSDLETGTLTVELGDIQMSVAFSKDGKLRSARNESLGATLD
jgi:hypothetical protein